MRSTERRARRPGAVAAGWFHARFIRRPVACDDLDELLTPNIQLSTPKDIDLSSFRAPFVLLGRWASSLRSRSGCFGGVGFDVGCWAFIRNWLAT